MAPRVRRDRELSTFGLNKSKENNCIRGAHPFIDTRLTMSNPGVRTLPTPLSLTDFDLGVTLGTGSFGRVRFATHRGTGSFWAIKMLKKAEVIRLQQVEHMISEKNILSNLDHPFIVRLSGTFQGIFHDHSVFIDCQVNFDIARSQVPLHGPGIYCRW